MKASCLLILDFINDRMLGFNGIYLDSQLFAMLQRLKRSFASFFSCAGAYATEPLMWIIGEQSSQDSFTSEWVKKKLREALETS